MKKLITLALVLCIGAFSGYVFGQQKDTQKNEKKGGFAVGGYDNAKQQNQEVKKRSVDINEAEEKAAEAVPPPTQAPPPPPAPAQKAKQAEKEKEGQANNDTREKQKAKKNSKSKGRR